MSEDPNGKTRDRHGFVEIDEAARAELRAALDAITKDVHERFRKAVRDRLDGRIDSPPEDYIRAIALQHLFCRLCGADAASLDGGDAARAAPIIRNLQAIAETWAQKA